MSFWNSDTDPDHEPHRVMIVRGTLVDEGRSGRKTPYKIYYPVAHVLKDLPLVLWSHGLGGSCDGAAFLGRFIASHGYVVMHIQHQGTDSSLWEGKPGHPWDVIRAAHISEDDIGARFGDVPFVLDSLPALCEQHPEIAEHINMKRIGMSGHSLGAITTQIMAGQMTGRKGALYSLHEPRLKACIAYSMASVFDDEDSPEVLYGPITPPIFYMTGTEDDSPITGADYTYRLPVFENAGGADQHLLVLEGGDHMVFAGSRGKLAAHPKRKIHEAIIKISSLAFWDAYLKEDQLAKDWLTEKGIEKWRSADVHYQYKR